MFDQKIPSTAKMDDEPPAYQPPAYQPPALTPYLSTPQYCMQPVPTVTHPQAISHIVTPCQPKVIYQQPVPVCIVETGIHPIRRFLVDSPSPITCPSCHENVVTQVTFHSGLLTWLLCIAIMFLGLVAGCCLIPFCMNATKDVDHFCPRCECHVFKYKRL